MDFRSQKAGRSTNVFNSKEDPANWKLRIHAHAGLFQVDVGKQSKKKTKKQTVEDAADEEPAVEEPAGPNPLYQLRKIFSNYYHSSLVGIRSLELLFIKPVNICKQKRSIDIEGYMPELLIEFDAIHYNIKFKRFFVC